MFKWFAFLVGWPGYVAAAGLASLLSIGATYYFTSAPYRITIAHMEAAQDTKRADDSEASLRKLNAYIAGMHEAGQEYQSDRTALNAKLDQLNRDFNDAIKNHPLPADCKPDDERMRALTAAVAAANAAATGSGFGVTVRTPPSPDSQ